MATLVLLYVALLVLTSCACSTVSTQSQGVTDTVQDNIEKQSCPPWYIRRKHNSNCTCGNHLRGIVSCSDDQHTDVKLKLCYCMTTDQHNTSVVVGACRYACVNAMQWYRNETLLNIQMCTETWKRTGQLCSQCIDNHGPLVHSYSMQCIPCSPRVAKESILYFLALFIPLTGLCLIIITLRISGARPPMSSFILVSQVMSAPRYLQLIFVPTQVSLHVQKKARIVCWKIFATFFGLWNLDICRAFYPYICFSSHMSTIQAQFLEYTIALFPLSLLIAIYFCVKLYDRGCMVVFCLCRPVHSCLARLRRTIDIQTSLIDAFATFIILSQNKIGHISFLILQPAYVYHPYGNYSVFSYTDPSLKYFRGTHLFFALPAVVLTVVFIVIPLLLLLIYPLKSFQNYLNYHQWGCPALHTFADAFQGCYKNGTAGTRDYRWFAGVHLFMRFVLVAIYDMTRYHKATSLIMIVTVSFYMVALAILQPYRRHAHLKQDMLLFFGLLLWSTSILIGEVDLEGAGDSFDFVLHVVLLVLSCFIPFAYFVGIILYWLLVVKKVHKWTVRRVLFSGERMRLLHNTAETG